METITQYKGFVVVNNEYERHWHLDKKVPIALIFAIFVQTAGAFWWASNITSRVDSLEKKQDSTTLLADRVLRLEVKLESSNQILEEIRDELRRNR